MHSALTFGTRNWTVRDMPPSHEAISIMKPGKEMHLGSLVVQGEINVQSIPNIILNIVL